MQSSPGWPGNKIQPLRGSSRISDDPPSRRSFDRTRGRARVDFWIVHNGRVAMRVAMLTWKLKPTLNRDRCGFELSMLLPTFSHMEQSPCWLANYRQSLSVADWIMTLICEFTLSRQSSTAVGTPGTWSARAATWDSFSCVVGWAG
eukprot:5344890-Pyramimonas_sp.AAC.1